MTVPMEYRQATRDFENFLVSVRDRAGLGTTNQAFTMVDGVLRTFRRRLEPAQAIAFAQLLPACLRALFIREWDLDEPRKAFGPREEMTREVKALRPDHNLSTESAIADVAAVLRETLGDAVLDQGLSDLPDGAKQFWFS
ncbi:uncharacterized protein (DUF2267 family) [Ciceribacter lividus]|uniref:Uncharacterized protein (DUF2267 family) n=1 Tax=Ciceribacter lividus TaxID=1197950 RepID=A0A6I7HNI9_9HYPH|nr:DUF2267 domain-containing protein [Ciceribacter lividus]RCW24845.1 uncharacterized protein (DUF2267 family) [Ciceribacter lividus]